MGTIALTPDLLTLVAERFKALSEPARLRILATLKEGACTVGELVERTGLGQANVSKHLRTLHELGFVEREREGLHVRYSLADGDVFTLCDLMCGRLQREHERRARLIG